MSKLKPRAKLREQSTTGRVAEYDQQHPGKSAADAAREMHLTQQQVYSCRNRIRKRKVSGVASSTSLPLDERDIVAIARIGVGRAERIIKLLRQLGR